MTEHDLLAALKSLPQHLAERTRFLSAGRSEPSGDRVVYWTHHALRCDENPALDVAIEIAKSLDLPLLVYQGLSQTYRFAADRHHTFILEAARDLQAAYGELGIAYALHVERSGFRQPRLAQLAATSAVIVTDDFPVEATRQWTQRLRTGRAAVVAVDTACVVPMKLVCKAYDRAFAFRDATAKLYKERLNREWPKPSRNELKIAELPFASTQLMDSHATSIASDGANFIADLVAECAIDHSIGPVADTCGGSQAAYARWNEFKRKGLGKYAAKRNTIEVDGVSRMSAYLHYGMISPMRIAREASQAGAEKFLDELLIWRELAYAFCFYREDVDTAAALPKWAIETLEKHERDPREVLSWERLARGRTGQRLWDAAQRSLLKHGELHNNVRMTWGKAVVHWSSNHRQALDRLIDLNHRYALDGRDPASYGGLLWCLGQFDRPFSPEQLVFGTVRSRPLEDHQRRVDMMAYEQRVARSVYSRSPRIAMIGAGIGGLLCARTLADHGLNVTCFEKSGRASGRAATRRMASGGTVDHGAQYFTVRDQRLLPRLQSWIDEGCVAEWQGRVVELQSHDGQIREVAAQQRYVGKPTMNALGQYLATDLILQSNTRVASIASNPVAGIIEPSQAQASNKYRLFDEAGGDLGEFDIVLFNCPPVQVEALIPDSCCWKARLANVEMLPCWAVMVAFEQRWEVAFDAAFINLGNLSWIARDSSKPTRDASVDTWVLHSNPEYAAARLDSPSELVTAELLAELSSLVGLRLPQQRLAQSHRWLYARPKQSLPESALWDSRHGLGACGDWCGGPRVEGAMLSGMALAGKVMGTLNENSRALIAMDSGVCDASGGDSDDNFYLSAGR